LRLARASRAAGDLASAINLYRGITAIKPADPALMVELGDTLVEAGAIDDAIDTYSQIPETSDSKLGALLGLERSYFALAEPDKALEYADKALARMPNDEKALIGRGVALDKLNRHEEAQASYRAVIASTPHNLAARNDLALSLALDGKFEEAVDIMTSIARSTTSTPRTRQNLALIYGLMGEKDRAKKLSLVDLSPTDTEANLRFFDLVQNNK
jgi:Flp pilus assembly protein TadD